MGNSQYSSPKAYLGFGWEALRVHQNVVGWHRELGEVVWDTLWSAGNWQLFSISSFNMRPKDTATPSSSGTMKGFRS